jgi:drug/metabolite transporter (DMT)-like permease
MRPAAASRALLLLAVVIWGWTFVATKILVAEIGPVEVFALRLGLGVPFLGLVLLWKRVPLRFARADLGPLLLGGAILTLHFLVQIAGIVTTTATNTAWIIAVSPLALAVPLLGEPFGLSVALGGGLVLAGVYLGQRDRHTGPGAAS